MEGAWNVWNSKIFETVYSRMSGYRWSDRWRLTLASQSASHILFIIGTEMYTNFSLINPQNSLW